MKLPQAVEVTEVGPRDGFQNLQTRIQTEDKLCIIDGLAECGFKKIEVTSFVHPKASPQMDDAAEVLRAIKNKYPSRFKCTILASTLSGAQLALDLGADEIAFVISASDPHNLENTKNTVEQSLYALASLCKIKGKALVRLAIATAFSCPFIGVMPSKNVMRLLEAGMTAGADEVALADTLGTANPLQVESLLDQLIPHYGNNIVLHLHDTYGMGMANVVTCLNMGITRFEASVGGLGGYQFAPGATVNIATEDLINMLHMMNIYTGIDNDKLISTCQTVERLLKVTLPGHILRSKRTAMIK